MTIELDHHQSRCNLRLSSLSVRQVFGGGFPIRKLHPGCQFLLASFVRHSLACLLEFPIHIVDSFDEGMMTETGRDWRVSFCKCLNFLLAGKHMFGTSL